MDSKLMKAQEKKLEEERMLLKARQLLLSTEKSLDEKTLDRIRDKWYNIMLKIRVPEMQDNLRYILHYMEKLIETHGFRKMLFEDERTQLEKLYTLQAQCQGSALERLNDIYLKRMEDMQTVYRQSVESKKKAAEEEFAQLEERENITRENMQTMLFQMEQNRNIKEDQMNCDMFFKIDDERSKNTEKLENIRGILEKKMENRWDEINATIATYDANTQTRRQHYMTLKAKDDYDSKIIHQQMKKTQKLIIQLEELKKCYEVSYAPIETLNLITDLREERAKFFDSFKYLKNALAEEVKEDKEQLKFLAVTTDGLTEELQETCSKGEKLLTLYRICRKFETEEEKVVPVGESLQLIKATDALEKRKHVAEERATTETTESLTENLCKDLEVLNKFWRKTAKVRLTTMAITKVLADLEKENELLRKSLVKYFKEVSGKVKKIPMS
ncbi:hypothetical protein RUM44_011631 [Polyplax serrata]|uniref:Dynein regulatory complex protein 1/2 N-terminal domain-containing protein n=1 Tax=Polyplax serrata TaxID=468196 RepID=A0ABR1AQK4_POLSC